MCFRSYEYSVNELCADERLLIRNVGRDAAGVYQCFVSNAAGTVSAAATVLVTDDSEHNSQATQLQADIQNIAPDGMYMLLYVARFPCQLVTKCCDLSSFVIIITD